MGDLTLPAALWKLEQAGAIRSRWLPGMAVAVAGRPVRYRWLRAPERYPGGGHFGVAVITRDKHGDECNTGATLAPLPELVHDTADPLTVQGLLLLLEEAFGGPAWVAPTGERQWSSQGDVLLPMWGCYAGGLTEPLTTGTCRLSVVEAALVAAAERLP